MWYNQIISPILMSPFHGLLSNSMMLISVTGRKSGKVYTLPVNYLQVESDFYIVSYHDRKWWRNLTGKAQVRVVYKRHVRVTDAEAIRDADALKEAFTRVFDAHPKLLRTLGLRADGQHVSRAAEKYVLVKMTAVPEATQEMPPI